jgi:hypothetical protein
VPVCNQAGFSLCGPVVTDGVRMKSANRPQRPIGASFTVNEWCAHRRVSRSGFYSMLARGTAPRIHRVGKGAHPRISAEADAAWLAKQESGGAA